MPWQTTQAGPLCLVEWPAGAAVVVAPDDLDHRDPVTGLSDAELAALAEQAYTDLDNANLWENEEPPELGPDVRSVVSMRFSRGELGQIQAAAEAAGLPVSTYIRNAAVNAVLPVDLDNARRQAAALRDELDALLGTLGHVDSTKARRRDSRAPKRPAA